MISKLGKEAMGLGDITTIVSRGEFASVDADDYIFHEQDEKIIILFKNTKDEYCFTDRAFIHVDGNSAVSKKRKIYRYEYITSKISNVTIETAGGMDRDIELCFIIANQTFLLNVKKDQLETLKDIYKALVTIDLEQKKLEVQKKKAETILASFKISEASDINNTLNTLTSFYDATYFQKIDYENVFNTFIKN